MSKQAKQASMPLTSDIQSVKANIQTSLQHHKKFRDQSGQIYNYHHQMVIHLQEQLDQLDQTERSEKS